MPKNEFSKQQIAAIKAFMSVTPENNMDTLDQVVYSIPSNIVGFDLATNYGGIPMGAILDIHGPEYVGKSVLLQALLASAQASGNLAALIEPENAATTPNLTTLGVDVDALITTETMERAYGKFNKGDGKAIKKYHPRSIEFLTMAINRMIWDFLEKRKGKQCLVIGIDSAPAMVTHDEIRNGANDSNFGKQTKLLAGWVKSLQALVSKSDCVTVIFINQERANIGAFGFQQKWREALGASFHYPVIVRIRVTHKLKIKDGTETVGCEHHCIVRKTKRGTEGKEFCFYTRQREGVVLGLWKFKELEETAIKYGVIKKVKAQNNTVYKFEGRTISKAKLTPFFRQNASRVREALRALIK